MSVVEMSVYTALKKRKIYEDRMNKITGSSDDFVTAITGLAVANPEEIEKIENKLKSNFDKKRALIDNYTAINAAINQSNATTRLEIAGKEYTVTQAISRYAHLSFEIEFLNDIKKNITRTAATVQKNNERTLNESTIVDFVKSMMTNLPDNMFSAENVDQNDQVREKYESKYREDYITRNTVSMVDPYGLADKIDTMVEELESFKADFNEALNICNIQTIITVELNED